MTIACAMSSEVVPQYVARATGAGVHPPNAHPSAARPQASVFERNVGYLAPKAVADRVRQAAPAAVRAIRSKSGALTLTFLDKPLCSRRDPVHEGMRWAKAQKLAGVDVAIVYGMGAGHHIEALRSLFEGRILVVEPSREVLKAALSSRPLMLERTWIADTAEALRSFVGATLAPTQNIKLVAWPPTRRLFPSQLAGATAALHRGKQFAEVTASTLHKRLQVWLDRLTANLPLSVGHVCAHELKSVFGGRTVFLVAAGPSLERNVEQLERVGDRGVIVAVNTSLAALEKAGVRADFVVSIEALDVSEQLSGLTLNRDCPRILSTTAHPELFRTATGRVYPFSVAISFFAQFGHRAGFGLGMPGGGSVANVAFGIARHLGASRLVLVGQDLAYTGGRAYAKGTVFEDMAVDVSGNTATIKNLEAKKRIAQSCQQIDTTREQEHVESVLAWGKKGRVPTTGAFNYFRFIFQEWASLIRDAELINATEGGAHIEGFVDRRLADVVDELPAAEQVAEVPTSPVITAELIRAGLDEERRLTMRVKDAVARCRAAQHDAALKDELAACVRECGLLQAQSWSSVLAVMRDPKADLNELCDAVERESDRLLVRLNAARGAP
jgi:hypothetical protein